MVVPGFARCFRLGLRGVWPACPVPAQVIPNKDTEPRPRGDENSNRKPRALWHTLAKGFFYRLVRGQPREADSVTEPRYRWEPNLGRHRGNNPYYSSVAYS